jgi:hypothetical protein
MPSTNGHDFSRHPKCWRRFRPPQRWPALAAELRRVQGSNATRAYLRRIITPFERFPAAIVAAPIQELASDP